MTALVSEPAARPATADLSARGRYVRVWPAGTAPSALTIAEVEVFGR
ncbi:hypothetical protein [Actinoplanes derwentensis]|nr:hypothetical protein [Actinoplanes derwentensis]